MALKKKITMSNGLPLEYHRIALVSIEPNQQLTILRYSYLNAEARQYEKDYAAGTLNLAEGEEPQFPYVDHEYMSMGYNEGIGLLKGGVMEGAYALLKELPEFAGAEDC